MFNKSHFWVAGLRPKFQNFDFSKRTYLVSTVILSGKLTPLLITILMKLSSRDPKRTDQHTPKDR